MHTLEQALDIILSYASPVETETLNLHACLDRILASDFYSSADFPRFTSSAMDGFACRKADLSHPLAVIERIKAGQAAVRSVRPGECIEIMTGAPVPGGADMVVPVENTEEKDNIVRIVKPDSGSNIRAKGEDLHQGDLLLKAGTLVTPQVMAILASAGYPEIMVTRKPVVGLFTTGDELVPVSVAPGPAQIHDSNSIQLTAQIQKSGADPRFAGIAKDDPVAVADCLERACFRTDLVLVSGGVSEGRYDFVPEVLEKNGFKILIHGMAIKPGKPLVFAVRGKQAVFGMPGNPVATFVLFHLLVKPFIQKMSCRSFEPKMITGRLRTTLSRKNSGREEFRPVIIDRDNYIDTVPYNGSAHIHAYADASAILSIPAGVNRLEANTEVKVRWL